MTQMKWYNEPVNWHEQAEILHVNTGAKTEFGMKHLKLPTALSLMQL